MAVRLDTSSPVNFVKTASELLVTQMIILLDATQVITSSTQENSLQDTHSISSNVYNKTKQISDLADTAVELSPSQYYVIDILVEQIYTLITEMVDAYIQANVERLERLLRPQMPYRR